MSYPTEWFFLGDKILSKIEMGFPAVSLFASEISTNKYHGLVMASNLIHCAEIFFKSLSDLWFIQLCEVVSCDFFEVSDLSYIVYIIFNMVHLCFKQWNMHFQHAKKLHNMLPFQSITSTTCSLQIELALSCVNLNKRTNVPLTYLCESHWERPVLNDSVFTLSLFSARLGPCWRTLLHTITW